MNCSSMSLVGRSHHNVALLAQRWNILPQQRNFCRIKNIQHQTITTTSKSKFFSNISTSFPIVRASSPIISKSSLFQVILLSVTSTTSLLALGNNNVIKCDDNNNSEGDNDNTLNKIIKSIKDSVEKGDYGTILDTGATHLGTQVQVMIDSGIPSQLSYGFVCGFCSGYALKKIGRSGAVVFGTGFIIMQGLSYTGYIQVNYEQVNKDISNMLDVNDDGKIDEKDAQIMYEKVLDVIGFNMPAGSGFGGGFLAGVKSG